MTGQEIIEAAEKAVTPPAFWPTELMDEFKVACAIKDCLNFTMADGSKVDIHVGHNVAEYMCEMQMISASSAELMGRMRKALEDARGKAIVEAMIDEKLDFKKLSATLQSRYVDSKISMMLAAYEYSEHLAKRVSYSLDACRSLLSFIKEDMRNSVPINQR